MTVHLIALLGSQYTAIREGGYMSDIHSNLLLAESVSMTPSISLDYEGDVRSTPLLARGWV